MKFSIEKSAVSIKFHPIKTAYPSILNALIVLFLVGPYFRQICSAQNTVGLIQSNLSEVSDGYTLIYPNGQSNIYLLNNCGQIAHKWINDENFVPNGAAYLLDNGNIVYTKFDNSTLANFFHTFDSKIRFIDMKDWEGNLIYSYRSKDDNALFHHDFYPLSNGNLLILAYEKLTFNEAISLGRDPTLIPHDTLWSDLIFEVNPLQDTIVWEWHAKDHFVQNLDSLKNNFGELHENPGLININHLPYSARIDIMHLNSLDYNQDLDQILVSSPYYNEIWIIDHSTTTYQAAQHDGGLSNKGGDLLFRWGNAQNYLPSEDSNQFLFFQHNARWVNNDLTNQDTTSQSISIFNNRIEDRYSAGCIIHTDFDKKNWQYVKNEVGSYLPKDIAIQITHPNVESLYSKTISSFQILDNGNYLLLDGDDGTYYELTNEREVVLEYTVPLNQGIPLIQGDEISNLDNNTFSITKYPQNYSAFQNKDLSPKGFIELEPNLDFCEILNAYSNPIEKSNLTLFPNPAFDFIDVNISNSEPKKIQIFNLSGQQLKPKIDENRISLEGLESGIYVIKIITDSHASFIQKFVIF